MSDLNKPEVSQPVVLKVIHGEICYKSKADDQSFGMWCPINPAYDHGLIEGTQFFSWELDYEALIAENEALKLRVAEVESTKAAWVIRDLKAELAQEIEDSKEIQKVRDTYSAECVRLQSECDDLKKIKSEDEERQLKIIENWGQAK